MDNTTSGLTIDYVERRAKFKKRAEGRLNGALRQMRQIQRCANRGIYAYDPDQVERLMRELRQGVDDVERAFRDAEGGPGQRWVEL